MGDFRGIRQINPHQLGAERQIQLRHTCQQNLLHKCALFSTIMCTGYAVHCALLREHHTLHTAQLPQPPAQFVIIAHIHIVLNLGWHEISDSPHIFINIVLVLPLYRK